MAGRIGRDVRLVHLADGEDVVYPPVRALHRPRILGIEGGFVLVDQDAVAAKRLVAVPIELPREQPGARSKGIGGIHDHQIVGVLAVAHEAQAVLIVQVHPFVVQLAGKLGQIRAAGLHDLLVDLHHIDALDGGVARQLAHRAAVPRADHKHLFDARVGGHRQVHDHFVIHVLVLFGGHHIAVQDQKASKFLGFKDVDLLKLAPL